MRLNKSQLEKLSDVSSDLALVSVASVVLPAVLDKFNTYAVLLGSVGAIFFVLLSLWLRKGR